MCGPRQLLFFQCGAETPKGWTPLIVQHTQPRDSTSSWPIFQQGHIIHRYLGHIPVLPHRTLSTLRNLDRLWEKLKINSRLLSVLPSACQISHLSFLPVISSSMPTIWWSKASHLSILPKTAITKITFSH